MFCDFFNKVLNDKTRCKKFYLILMSAILTVLVSLTFFWTKHLKPTDIQKPKSDWIRVLLSRKVSESNIAFQTGFKIAYVSNDDLVEIAFSKGKFGVNLSNGVFNVGDLKIDSDCLILEPTSEPFVSYFNGKAYRANIELHRINDSCFDVVNNLPIEPYVLSVVGCEMPVYWKSEAIKAQAIACRTYALYHKQTYGQGRHYDIQSSEGSQVYQGVEGEHWLSKGAIEQTSGLIMLCKNEIFPAYYSSICGGHTEDSFEVFGKSFEAVQAVKCPYCIKTAPESKFYWQPHRIESKELTRKLVDKYPAIKELGEIKDITARKKTDHQGYYRWTNVILTGANGKTITLRAEDFRLALDWTGRKIRSTIFEIANIDNTWIFFGGRGFGHGVGMCQYGANGMAKEGLGYEEILKFYYNNIEIRQMNK